jgi:CO/xanthine dehydrogenase FAD-binding subunit
VRRPGEILSQIFVPRTVENAASTFLKLGARRYLVISIAMVAAVIQKDSGGRVSDARVAIGSCSVAARRLPDLERALIGAPLASGAATPTLGSIATADHLKDLSPIGDVRATAAYRRDAALRLVQRALDACAGSS